MAIEILFSNKTGRFDAHDRIYCVGGIESGIRWKKSESQVISEIENGRFSYYIKKGPNPVLVIVAAKNGKKYLKAITDGEQPDSLVGMPECP